MTGEPGRPPKDQAARDAHVRNAATSRQAKHRRLNGDEPVRRGQMTIEQLPLFADEKSLSEAVLGRGMYTHWRAVVPLLERRGFPTIDGLMGGRYWPAVDAYFRVRHGVPTLDDAPPIVPKNEQPSSRSAVQAGRQGQFPWPGNTSPF